MSILVRGIDMPKCCRDCKLYERGRDGIYCKATTDFEWDENRQFKPWKHRMKNCPLVEIKTPHGRIVDIDKVLESLFKSNGEMTCGDVISETTILEAKE